jgi:hypothetical protein
VTPAPERPRPSLARGLLRRLPILIVGALLLWLFGGDRPRQVELSYLLPATTVRAEVELREEGSDALLASLAWGDGRAPAASPRGHAPTLPPGRHRLEARLTDGTGGVQLRKRTLEIGADDATIVLHLEVP